MDLSSLGPWLPLLGAEVQKPYFQALIRRVDEARAAVTVYPPEQEVFRAFALTPPDQVRVVILGQDPYHGAGEANGLAFSVREGVKIPPSLRNMFQELDSDLHCSPPLHGDLTGWAKQGVLLLNTVLTVEQDKANSHKTWGWQTFTDAVVDVLATLPQPMVFVLWGNQAQKKKKAVLASPHVRAVLESPHPSPLSSYRGFFGSRVYSKINEFLTANGQTPIDFSQS